MRNHKTVDSKILSKYMPNLSCDLREEKVSANDIDYGITVEFLKRHPGVIQDDPSSSIWKKKMIPIYARFMETGSLDFVPNYRELLHPQDLVRFRNALNRAVSDNFSTYRYTPLGSTDCQEGFHKACQDFADIFDEKLFGNTKGEFLRQCPLYGLPFDEFWNLWIEELKANHEGRLEYLKLRNDIFIAAHGVAIGALEVRKQCWECNSIQDFEIFVCSRCSFACYCSKSCQRKAWQQQHKKTCAELAIQKQKLDSNIQTIRDVHEQKDANTGISILSDFYCLKKQLHWKERESLQRLLGCGEPSMKLFYKNLDMVRQGKFWVIKDADPLDIYMKQLGTDSTYTAGVSPDDEIFIAISCLLAFDLQSLEDSSNIYALVATRLGLPESKMPAERFLILYTRNTIVATLLKNANESPSTRDLRFAVKLLEHNLRCEYEPPFASDQSPASIR